MCSIAYGSMGERRVGDWRRLLGVARFSFLLVPVLLVLLCPTTTESHPLLGRSDGGVRTIRTKAGRREARLGGESLHERGERELWQDSPVIRRSLLIHAHGQRKVYLVTKAGKILIIFENGTVASDSGANNTNPRLGEMETVALFDKKPSPSLLSTLKPGGTGEWRGSYVAIKGVNSGMYLCMTSDRGRLYGSKNLNMSECKFNETLLPNNYWSYCRDFTSESKAKGGWCVCMNGSGGIRMGSRCNMTNPWSAFLPRPVKTDSSFGPDLSVEPPIRSPRPRSCKHEKIDCKKVPRKRKRKCRKRKEKIRKDCRKNGGRRKNRRKKHRGRKDKSRNGGRRHRSESVSKNCSSLFSVTKDCKTPSRRDRTRVRPHRQRKIRTLGPLATTAVEPS